MDLHADEAGQQPAPDFIPDTWLTELESQARIQVWTDPSSRLRERRLSGVRVVGILLGAITIVVLGSASIVWAVTVGPVAIWLIGGFCFAVAGTGSVWIGRHVDGFIDAVGGS